MEEFQPSQRGAIGECLTPRRLPTWALLVHLIALATSLQVWLIQHTEVTARDSIGFIRYALQFEELPWPEVLRENQHHPGYPLAIWAVSVPVRRLLGVTDSHSMQLSAQIANSLAGILLVIPMFYLGARLFDRGVGFWAAALFQCLPASARVLADGLSDGLYLFWSALALLLAVWALEQWSPRRFAWCGLCVGAAYLTRPEGVLLGLAIGAVILGAQLAAVWNRTWKSTFHCGAALAATALLVASPYAVTIGGFTNKISPQIIMRPAPTASATTSPEPAGYTSAGFGATAFLQAVWSPDYSGDGRSRDMWWGLGALGYEMLRGFNYLACVLALLGLCWFRGRLRTVPGLWVLLLMATLQTLALWRMASVMGYVSERHTLMVVLCLMVWAVAAARELPARLMAGGNRLASLFGQWSPSLLWDSRVWSLLLLLVLTSHGLPKTMKPLHANRAGHLAAGQWLANHVQTHDTIVDPFCWARYYAGRFSEKDCPSLAGAANAGKIYVIMDHSTHHSHLPGLHEAEELTRHGHTVFSWPAGCPEERADVLIYEVP